jgi:hypothetical protein
MHLDRLRRRLSVVFTILLVAGGPIMAERCTRSVQEFRDKSHRLIGRIVTRPDFTQEARNDRHRLLGYYSPSQDETRDARYRLLGKGNSLSALIWQDWTERQERRRSYSALRPK